MFLASLFEPVNHTLSLYRLLADPCSTPVFLFHPGFLVAPLCTETRNGAGLAAGASSATSEDGAAPLSGF